MPVYFAIMFDESPKRFDRIVAILIQLQSKKIVKAQELADRFEVSLRTIYRDIRSLETSGVPIYSEAGIGYSLVEGYRLPPVMFTREEAGSFIAAEKLMQQFTDKELGGHYASAMYKLKAVLRGSDQDLVETMEKKVLVRNANDLSSHKTPNALTVIFRGIGEKTQLVLMYQAGQAEEISQRIIEPIGVLHENNNWYVFGFCQLRNDYRQFRTDRIHDIQKTDLPFTQQHQPFETYLKDNQSNKTKVRISIDSNVAKYLHGERRNYGFVSEEIKGEQTEMTFMCLNTANGFARWFMMFADCAAILEPESLRERVEELLGLSLEKIQKK